MIDAITRRQIVKAKNYTKKRLKMTGCINVPVESFAKDGKVSADIMRAAWLELCETGECKPERKISTLYGGEFQTVGKNYGKVISTPMLSNNEMSNKQKVETYLTQNNVDISQRVGNKEISKNLGIPLKTVEKEIYNLRKKQNITPQYGKQIVKAEKQQFDQNDIFTRLFQAQTSAATTIVELGQMFKSTQEMVNSQQETIKQFNQFMTKMKGVFGE